MSGRPEDSPVPRRDLTYWISLVAYIFLGVPLVITVASHVVLAPILVVKLFNPPEWLDFYVLTPLSYAGFVLSVWAVWWVWKLFSRQLASRAV